MRSAITATLVLETKAGPFVFSAGLADAFSRAAELGFDAVEIFPPSAGAIDVAEVSALMQRHNLDVAAIGTGAGWVLRKLSLTHSDAAVRRDAREFVRGIIDIAARFQAPAIIGSMQGRWEGATGRDAAMSFLAEALEDLGAQAGKQGTTLLFEPLNRYETNLFNRVGDCAAWLRTIRARNVRILADLFHMNIEEASSSAALRENAASIGHVHFADSNRRAVGMGQTAMAPIMDVLREIGYDGYLSAEVVPLPDPMTAARQTISAFTRFTGPR